MKNLISATIIFATMLISSCNSNKNLVSIQPKNGILEIPAKGELRMWNNTKHASFKVILTNSYSTQSCEVYYENSKGNEKWINPSLLANTSLTVSIPANGNLFLKNFNDNIFKVSYNIEK
jgi:hypothetical protein